MNIPFTKAHGAENDFLFTWLPDLPAVDSLNRLAIHICHRHTGVGADGWFLVSSAEQGCDIHIRLFNSDGSEVEMSGNGTRCAAAWALENGKATGPQVKILTGAGPKSMKLLERDANRFLFEMDMGSPQVAVGDLETTLEIGGDTVNCTVIHVGNPQCVVFVENFDFDWARMGAEIEAHPRFPNRTNVSFVKIVDAHSIEVRFFERGVGVTKSSGTGATGAMAASVLRGLSQSPVAVHTPAGVLNISWKDTIELVGPAELTVTGLFILREK